MGTSQLLSQASQHALPLPLPPPPPHTHPTIYSSAKTLTFHSSFPLLLTCGACGGSSGSFSISSKRKKNYEYNRVSILLSEMDGQHWIHIMYRLVIKTVIMNCRQSTPKAKCFRLNQGCCLRKIERSPQCQMLGASKIYAPRAIPWESQANRLLLGITCTQTSHYV